MGRETELGKCQSCGGESPVWGSSLTGWECRHWLLLLLLLVLSRTFEKDLNMTETETTTCPLSYIQAGIVASTGLPFNDIFAPIWASVLRWLRSSASSVDFCNNLLKKARNMFARRAHSIPLPFSSPSLLHWPSNFSSAFSPAIVYGVYLCVWR